MVPNLWPVGSHQVYVLKVNNASMDYPLVWRQVFVTGFSLAITLRFSKIVILEFSDSATQILVFFCLAVFH